MSFKAMFTTKNVGTIDRIVRALPIVIVVALYFLDILTFSWAVGLGVVSLMLLATSLLGACSIYYLLGYSTCPILGQANPKIGSR